MNRSIASVQPLPELLERLRERGLRQGIGPMAGETADLPRPGARGAVPTGFATLDDALRTGGWPRGALALLDAPRGGGATSLAIRTLAAAQDAGGIVAWIDVAGCLDPATLARLGVRLEWMLVVRPASGAEAVELAGWIARSGLVDALALDLGEQPDPAELVQGLNRLARLLVRGRAVMLLLAGERLRQAAEPVAGVRLSLAREAWLTVGRDLVGQRVRATVARHRWALAGATASLDLWFGEGRRIDPLLQDLAAPREVAPASASAADEAEERPALRILSA